MRETLLFLFMFVIQCLGAQEVGVVNMGGRQPKDNTGIRVIRDDVKKNVKVLTIGIGDFTDKNFGMLHSYSILDGFKDVAEKYIKPSYQTIEPVKSLNNYVKWSEVRDALKEIANNANSSDIIIISILSHGVVGEDGEYYLVCSDTKSNDYEHTAISGRVLRDVLHKVSDSGALVLVFLDTCNASALFDDSDFKPKNHGILVFYASSNRGENAKEIYLDTRFTSTIINTFKNQNRDAFVEKIGQGSRERYLTIKSLGNQIESSVTSTEKAYSQTPMMKIFPSDSILLDYVIMKENKSKSPRKKIPFYIGASFGTNFEPTPYANLNIGVDINHWKFEAGYVQAFTKSSDVYLYDENGILQGGNNYVGRSFYVRGGYDLMSLGKNESRLEIVPLLGFSGNIVKGSPIFGFNGNTGEKTGSLMIPISCRFAYDLSKNKNRNFLLHGTVGCDVPLEKDNVLSKASYIKNWCSLRPKLEIGVMVKLFNL